VDTTGKTGPPRNERVDTINRSVNACDVRLSRAYERRAEGRKGGGIGAVEGINGGCCEREAI
jgi:hypothetical protein